MPLNTNLLRAPAAIEFPDQVNRLAQFSQIQNAQNQNALAQYTLAAAQRGENVKSALDRAYLKAYNPQTGQIDPSRLRGAVIEAQIGSELPAIEKSIAEVEKAQLARKKEFGEVVNQKLAQSKGLLANVNSNEGFLAWYDANNADPVLGEYFKSRGMNNEQARAALSAQLAQPGGLQRLIAISASSLDKLPETLENQQAQAVLGGRTPTQPMTAPTTNNIAPTAPQAQPVANAMVAPVQTAAVPPPAVTAMPAVSGLQGELSKVNDEIARLQSSGSAGLGAVQKRIGELEQQKARLFTAINQERQADTSAKQAKLAAERLAFEQSTAADFRSSPSGVVRIDKITGETRIVKDANGKPVMDVAAAQAAEAARHARVIESQGASKIELERTRADLERQRVDELKNDKVVANTVTDEAGNVTQYNRYGVQIGETKKGVGKPSASFTKLRDQRAQLAKDLGAAISELTEITKDGGLIDQSTGSGVGRLVDVGKGFFGGTTPGAIATAKLKPIQDLVLKTIPRFEGPQSDKDTQSYKEAAGQLADPNMPTAIRKEAAKTVLRLMTDRKNQFVTPEMAAEGVGASGGGVKFLGFEP